MGLLDGFWTKTSSSTASYPIYLNTYYVNPANGLDTNSGTNINQPVKTLSHACALAGSSGATIFLAPATYSEVVTISNLNLNVVGISSGEIGVTFAGNLTVNGTGSASSVRFVNIKFTGTVNKLQVVSIYFYECRFTNFYTASGQSYQEFNNCLISITSISNNGRAVFNTCTFTNAITFTTIQATLQNCSTKSISISTSSTVNLFNTTSIVASGFAVTVTQTSNVYFIGGGAYLTTGLPTGISVASGCYYSISNYVFTSPTLTGTSLGTVATYDSINLINPLTVSQNGTGFKNTATDGSLLIGSSSGYQSNQLTAGSNCLITTSASGIEVSAISSILNIPTWNKDTSYGASAIVNYLGVLYIANGAISATPTFNVGYTSGATWMPLDGFPNNAIAYTYTITSLNQITQTRIDTGSTFVFNASSVQAVILPSPTVANKPYLIFNTSAYTIGLLDSNSVGITNISAYTAILLLWNGTNFVVSQAGIRWATQTPVINSQIQPVVGGGTVVQSEAIGVIGKVLFLNIVISFTEPTTSSGNGTYLIPIPSPYQIDTSFVPANQIINAFDTGGYVGSGIINFTNGTTDIFCPASIMPYDANNLKILFQYCPYTDNNVGNFVEGGQNGSYNPSFSNNFYKLTARVPIL